MIEETVEEVKEVEGVASDFKPASLDEIFAPPSTNSEVEAVKTDVAAAEGTKSKEAVEEAKTNEKSKTEEEAKTEEPKPINWDDEANPYKNSTGKLETQYKNTRDWATKAYKLVKEYGIEIDEPEFEKEEENRNNAQLFAFNHRELASRQAASEIYGEDFVNKTIYAVDSAFAKLVKDKPELYQRMFVSKAPVLEAIKIVKEQNFFGKYGSDVEKIPEKIKKELETELREKITKELQKKLTKKEELPNTLSGVTSRDVNVENAPFTPTPLERIFG